MMPSPLGEEAARQQAREVTAAAQGGRRGGRKQAPSSASRFWGSPLISRVAITLSAWLAAFLIVFVLVALFGEQLDSLPLAVRLLVISGVMVIAMVNLVEPLLRRLANRFVGAGSQGAGLTQP
jgi:hypothetical protein